MSMGNRQGYICPCPLFRVSLTNCTIPTLHCCEQHDDQPTFDVLQKIPSAVIGRKHWRVIIVFVRDSVDHLPLGAYLVRQTRMQAEREREKERSERETTCIWTRANVTVRVLINCLPHYCCPPKLYESVTAKPLSSFHVFLLFILLMDLSFPLHLWRRGNVVKYASLIKCAQIGMRATRGGGALVCAFPCCFAKTARVKGDA